MHNLTKRIITAAILLLIVIFIILKADAELTVSFISIVLFLSFFEFSKMLKLEDKKQDVLLFFLLVISPIAFAVSKHSLQLFSIFGLFYILTLGFFFNQESLQEVQKKTFIYFLGFILLGLGGYALSSIAYREDSTKIMLWLLAIVSFNDICAYAGGRLIGGLKYNKIISPNKTVSGAVCGVLGAICVSYLLVNLLNIDNLKYGVLFPTIMVAWCAQIGDLIESLIKRIVGVKDSSNLLPGHGGVLDRVDAILGAAPLTLICFL